MASPILITGATGFIGRHLTRQLIAAGQSVRVLARNPRKAQALFGDAVEISIGDLSDPTTLSGACTGIETVYHIAGVYRFGLRHRREMYRANIDGTENLLAAASAVRVGRFVHVSSASVFRRSSSANPHMPLRETDFPAKAPRFSPYKFSKWESERRALAWNSRGLPVVIANPSCPIGAGDEMPTPTGQMIRDFLRDGFPCYSQVGLNFVNVTDVGTGLQAVAARGRIGERYLLSNQDWWLKDFLQCLADQTGQPVPRTCLPVGLIRALSGFGEIFDLLNFRSKTARLCIETALQAGHAQFFDNTKARTELGWTPSSIQIGARQAIAWYQNEPGFESACATLPVTKSHAR